MQHRRCRTIVLLSLLLTCGGCGRPSDEQLDVVYDACSPVVVVPSSAASEQEIDSLRVAIEMWNRTAQTRLTTEHEEGAEELPIEFEKAAPAFYGLYDDENGIVFINRELHEFGDRTITIAHEIGHAFGLLHVTSRESVMNRGNLEIVPNRRDAEAVHELWGPCE